MHVTRAWIACLAPLLLSGCAIGYGLQAARGQWQLSRVSEPIADVLSRPDTSTQLRAQLRSVQSAREFAVHDLQLPDNKSYTRYAELRRPYLVWNVVATPELSLTPRRWCFPVAGCVGYRGYFRERSADRFATRQRRRGDDVMVGGVPAYSTLGYFADPVPDTLLRYGELAVAETVMHELAHQRLYVPGDSDFNEAFATVVAQAGLTRWLQAQGRSDDLRRITQRQVAEREFESLLIKARHALSQLYVSSVPANDKRRTKAQMFSQLATELLAAEKRHGSSTVYSEWARSGLNNAHLAALATYSRCVPGLQRLLTAVGGDIATFYQRAESLAKAAPVERWQAVCNDAAD